MTDTTDTAGTVAAEASAVDTIRWYHRALAAPLRTLADRELGPFGGGWSLPAIIEGTVQHDRGVHDFGHPLSDTEQVMVGWLSHRLPAELVEYRDLSHEVQRVILDRYGEEPLTVIWVGAGVFTLHHPLVSRARPDDRHLWTDATAEVALTSGRALDLRPGRPPVDRKPVKLPEDVGLLNQWIERLTGGPKRLVIFAYGVGFTLTPEQNHEWLSRLEIPADVDCLIVFNSPGPDLPLWSGVMAAFCGQRMVHYPDSDVGALFARAVHGSEVVWHRPRETTTTGEWGTWLFERPAKI